MTQEKAPAPADAVKEPTDPVKQSAPGPGKPADPDSQSVAGEEDPGASLDMQSTPPGSTDSMTSGGLKPGDEAPRVKARHPERHLP